MNKLFALKYIGKLFDDYCSSISKFKHVLVDKNNYVSLAYPHKGLRPYVQIAVSNDFLDSSTSCVKEYDFVEAVISVHHECYHIKQYNADYHSDIYNELESYISRCKNNGIYYSEYNMFLHEIAAERYALHKTYEDLYPLFKSDLDLIILDYVNSRMHPDDNILAYFIQSNRLITDMQTVFCLFDEKYEFAKSYKKSFVDYPDDCVGKMLSENDMLLRGFDRANDGEEQTHFAATIVLHENPELCRELKGVKKTDYNLQEIIEAGTQRDYLHRELPAIDDRCDDDFQLQ